jgi:hypothetical protein
MSHDLVVLHLGALHPAEKVLTLLLAFGPFVVLGAVIAVRRRRERGGQDAGQDALQDAEQHPEQHPEKDAGQDAGQETGRDSKHETDPRTEDRTVRPPS